MTAEYGIPFFTQDTDFFRPVNKTRVTRIRPTYTVMIRRDNIIIMIFILILFVSHAKSGRNNQSFFPNLPAGEYRWYFKSMANCSLPANTEIKFQHSFYMSKTSRNTFELKGSITNKIPFDDSLTFNANFAIKDSIGGWKDNAIVYKAPKSCSTSKRFVGDDWPRLMKAFGVNSTNCPILPGTYVSKGFDLSTVGSNLNIPKTFFYGVYKLRIYFTDHNEKICSCGIFIIEVKRPWEEE